MCQGNDRGTRPTRGPTRAATSKLRGTNTPAGRTGAGARGAPAVPRQDDFRRLDFAVHPLCGGCVFVWCGLCGCVFVWCGWCGCPCELGQCDRLEGETKHDAGRERAGGSQERSPKHHEPLHSGLPTRRTALGRIISGWFGWCGCVWWAFGPVCWRDPKD